MAASPLSHSRIAWTGCLNEWIVSLGPEAELGAGGVPEVDLCLAERVELVGRRGGGHDAGVHFLKERGGTASRLGVHEHQPALTDMRPQGGLITTRRMANRVQLLCCRPARRLPLLQWPRSVDDSLRLDFLADLPTG